MDFEKTLSEIIENQSFELLDLYQDSKEWSLLNQESKEKLALLCITYAEQLLKKGEGRFIDLFDRACKIAPNSPEVFYRLARAYFSKIPNPHYVYLAKMAAEQSIALDSKFLNGYAILSEILLSLGLQTDDYDLFVEANQKFQKLEQLRKEKKIEDGYFFYRWGLCCHLIAKRSGEALDYHLAVSKYRIAVSLGFKNSHFLNDFGNALVDLGCLLCREAFFTEAIDLYRQVVKESPDFFEGWFNLACSYSRVFELTQTGQIFHQAYECFERASLLNSHDPILWLKWAGLLVLFGKEKRRKDFILASLDKFEKADLVYPNNPQVLCEWAEALTLVGAEKGRLDLLKEAEYKISQSIDLQPDRAESWSIYGFCLMELGRYFTDTQVYKQAMEKIQQGLSLNRNYAPLWYGLGLVNFALGELDDDYVFVERAVQYFSQAVEITGNRNLQYWNDWGVALMKLGEMTSDRSLIELGVQKLEHAIKMHCKKHEASSLNIQWLYNYGCALDFLGDCHLDPEYYQQAIQVFTQILLLEPEYFSARYTLGITYSHLAEIESDLGTFEKAIEQFQIIIASDVEDDLAWNEWGLALLHMAQFVYDESQPDLSLKIYQEAEEKLLNAVVFGSIQANYNLSCLYSLIGNFSASIHYLSRAESLGALPSMESLLDDEWLSAVRETDIFLQFINHLSEKLEETQSD